MNANPLLLDSTKEELHLINALRLAAKWLEAARNKVGDAKAVLARNGADFTEMEDLQKLLEEKRHEVVMLRLSIGFSPK